MRGFFLGGSMKPVICDYCGKPAVFTKGESVYPHRPDLKDMNFWVCSPCDARVGCLRVGDGTKPMGRLADASLRAAKQKAHRAFDPIWKEGERSRSEAYAWLAHRLGLEKDECHIGLFDIRMCGKVVVVCKQLRNRNDEP